MRVLVQRSKHSSVSIEGELVGEIDFGLVLLVGFTAGDNEEVLEKMLDKVLKLRIFDDDAGVMNKSILDVEGRILSISQFTLYANTLKGNRPSYIRALNGREASVLYEKWVQLLRKRISTETGVFGSDMQVNILNDGPITIMLEIENKMS